MEWMKCETSAPQLLILVYINRKIQRQAPIIAASKIIYKSMPLALPDVLFFRHIKGNGAAKPEGQFGKEYIYKWGEKISVSWFIGKSGEMQGKVIQIGKRKFE